MCSFANTGGAWGPAASRDRQLTFDPSTIPE
jgi:hypothetical protein